jgi:hypothetical protein
VVSRTNYDSKAQHTMPTGSALVQIKTDMFEINELSVARLEGFEPPTPCSGGTCSIHLSYRRAAKAPRPASGNAFLLKLQRAHLF